MAVTKQITPHIGAALAFVAVSLFGPTTVTQASAEPQRGQQQRQRENMRFQGMDTNGDGRITRDEWRGNGRSFRNHDWNNDGMLSGDELRTGWVRNQPEIADTRGFYNWTVEGFRNVDGNDDGRITRAEWRYDPELFVRADQNRDNVLSRAEFLGDASIDRDPEDSFDDLDTNNNGRIERDEWHGTRQAFDWLDSNNDGRLSRSETVGNESVTGATDRRTNTDVVVISSQVRWTDTGINVTAGDRLVVRSEGTISMSTADDAATAAGSRTGRKAPDSPFPQMAAGGLIGRIGDSGPFFVGDGGTLSQVPVSGRLFLGVNDDYLADNRGEFRVTVTVRQGNR